LLLYLGTHVQFGGAGRVFAAPCDVELPLTSVVVQPDLIVVLNAHLAIITAGRIVGTPDLVVEILSPGTAGHDRREKQDAYARAGVPEYWLAGPFSHTVEVLFLKDDSYQLAGVFAGAVTLPSGVLPDSPVRVEQFFAKPESSTRPRSLSGSCPRFRNNRVQRYFGAPMSVRGAGWLTLCPG
jgi:Uma2 family endonuclease